ncbi:WXG100 family type VII secretion target [Xylanimonas sp. McL0601]|uniref:WXG100 family type VII secretion target n=1 Tax=Xylanimonas sp. McL0601 TaxID=3414739 RepID=UPI003CEC3ECE
MRPAGDGGGSGNYLGLNPEDMQQLITMLNNKAGKIEEIAQKLTQQVKTTTWDGPDAARFKNEWDSDHSKKLHKVAQALEQIAKSAKQELNQQTQTSH